AIIQPELTVNFGQLRAAIEAAAEHFLRSGLDNGTPIAVANSNPAKMLIASLGLLRAGLSVVPVNEGLLQSLSSVGVTTLVGERDGIVLNAGTTILFDDGW